MNQYLIITLIAVGLMILSFCLNLFVASRAKFICKYLVQVDYDGMIKNHVALSFQGYNDTDMKAFYEATAKNGKEAEEAIKAWELNPKKPKEGYCITYRDKDKELSRVFYDSTYPYKGCEIGAWWWPLFGIKKDHMRLIYKNYGNNSASWPLKSADEQAPDKEYDDLENTHSHRLLLRTLKENNFPMIAIVIIVALVVLGLAAWQTISPPHVIVTGSNVTTQVKR